MTPDDRAGGHSAWRETWADFVFESRRASGIGARLRAALAFLAALARLVIVTLPTGEHPMRNVSQDIRYAARRLRHTAGFSAFAIATLGLGIGAVTVVYSVVHALVLKAPAVPEIDKVLKLYHWSPDDTSVVAFSWPDFEVLKARQTTFTKVAAWSRFSHAMALPDGSRTFQGEFVDGNYFDVLRVQPALGRLLQAADDDPAAPAVIVIGEKFWRGALAGDAAVVGRTVTINGNRFEVVGVAPAWFRGVNAPNVMTAAAWIPIGQRFLARREGSRQFRDPGDVNNRFVHGIGRLRADRTAADAATELRLFGQQLDASVPLSSDIESTNRARPDTSRQWSVRPMAESPLGDDLQEMAAPMSAGVMTAVGLVLLVVCTNLANLLLARGASRRQEMAVRLALGAARLRLIREQIIESTMLAVAGGVVGLIVSRGLMVWLAADIPVGDGIGQTMSVRPELNTSVFALAIGATLGALLSFGVVPAWHSTRGHVREVMSDASGGALPKWRGRRYLIAGQVAVSLVLLGMTAVSLSQSARSVLSDPGYDVERLGVVSIDASLSGMSESRVRAALDQAVRDVRVLPGVTDVTLSSRLPAGAGGTYVYTTTPDRPLRLDDGFAGWAMKPVIATPSFFAVAGVAVMSGRAFDERDGAGAPPVVVLSERSASQLFGSTAVVGRMVELKRQDSLGAAPTPIRHATVIGIARDTDTVEPVKDHGGGNGIVYLPFAQEFSDRMMVLARTDADPNTVSRAMRTAVVNAEPQLTILEAASAEAYLNSSEAVFGVAAGVTGALGGFALVLSLVGLYGVLSFVVSRRSREIGVRIALGARPDQVRRMMVADGLKPVVWGLIAGCALLAPIMLSPFVLGLPSMAANIVAVLFVPVLMLASASAAAYWPARRASRTDPNVALRTL